MSNLKFSGGEKQSKGKKKGKKKRNKKGTRAEDDLEGDEAGVGNASVSGSGRGATLLDLLATKRSIAALSAGSREGRQNEATVQHLFRTFKAREAERWDGRALRSTKEIYETDFRVETFKSHAATLKYLGGGGHLAKQQRAAEERIERVCLVLARSKITLTLTPQSHAATTAKPPP